MKNTRKSLKITKEQDTSKKFTEDSQLEKDLQRYFKESLPPTIPGSTTSAVNNKNSDALLLDHIDNKTSLMESDDSDDSEKIKYETKDQFFKKDEMSSISEFKGSDNG